jgi:hypothetical protein
MDHNASMQLARNENEDFGTYIVRLFEHLDKLTDESATYDVDPFLTISEAAEPVGLRWIEKGDPEDGIINLLFQDALMTLASQNPRDEPV